MGRVCDRSDKDGHYLISDTQFCQGLEMNQQSNAILCPRCRRLVSSDEAQCPHCGFRRPGASLGRTYFTRLFYQPDQLIKTIIYINVGMYVLSLLLYTKGIWLSLNPLNFLSPYIVSLKLLGATGIDANPFGPSIRWWTLISANFLHGSLVHLFFNMAVFKQIATLIIREYGSHRMFVLYLLGGIVGFGVSCLAGIRVTIGASAAVCSLIGSAIYYGKSRGGLYGQAIYRQIGAWAAAILVLGLIIPGINNWGHVGGFLAGIGGGFLLGYTDRKPEASWQRTFALLLALLTAAILSWAAASGVYYRVIG